MKNTDNKIMWAIIEGMNWAGRCNESRIYDTMKIEFMRRYREETAKNVQDFVTARYSELYKEYNKFSETGSTAGHFGGDDSFSDMMHHVIGMGEKTFKSVMKDMNKLNKIKFVESFSYALPYSDDYKHTNDDFHVERAKLCIKELANVVNEESCGADKVRVIKELFSRFMSIIESNYIDAFADLNFDDDYSRFLDISDEYSAMFANYLFDAKKNLEVN